MEEKKNRHITLWVILILLLITIAGSVAYIYHDKSQQINEEDAEKAAWLKIQKWEGMMQLDSLENAIAQYQDTFIHGRHADMVESIRQKIENERKDWQTARMSDSVEAIEDFVRNHSDSYYRNEANRKIDSLSYIEATDEDTYDAYERYLDSFGDGIYAKDAQKRMDTLDGGTISDKETEHATLTLQRHFNALATSDRETLVETTAPVLETYIGMTAAGRADVEVYMKNMHTDENRTITFVIKNIIVTKKVSEHVPTYEAQFTLDEQVAKGSNTETLNFVGNARINSEQQITSLILSRN